MSQNIRQLDCEYLYPDSAIEWQWRGIRLDTLLLCLGAPLCVAVMLYAFVTGMPLWPAVAAAGACPLGYAVCQYGHDTNFLRRKSVYWASPKRLCCFRKPTQDVPFPVDRRDI